MSTDEGQQLPLTHDQESWWQDPRLLARAVIPPIAVWLLMRTIDTIRALNFTGPFGFDAKPWTRLDAFNYLAIASGGRTLTPCPASIVHLTHAHLCGTAAWLPGFPYVVRAVAGVTGWTDGGAAVLIVNLATLGFLGILWIGLLWRGPLLRGGLVLLGIAIFPGSVFSLALFPVSLGLLGVSISIVALHRGRPLLSALGLALGVICYPSVIYAVPALMVVLALSAPQGRRLRRAALGLVAPIPLVLMFLHDHVVFHRWSIYLVMQRESNATLLPPHNPFSQAWHLVVDQDAFAQLLQPHAKGWIAAQFVVASVICIGAVGVALWARTSDFSLTLDLYPALVGLFVYGGVILSGVLGGWLRSIATAAPAMLLARRLPTWAVALVVGATAVVTAGISHFYFTRALLYAP